jgi:glutathione S-transferase
MQLALQLESSFCYGGCSTLADCCLVPQIFNAQLCNTQLNDLPHTMAAFDNFMKLDARQ